MKEVKKIEIEFKRGGLYPIENTMLCPPEYETTHFRKPTFKEENYGDKSNNVNDYSDYNYCVKGIKIVTKVYTN